jgi:6-pyruvoyltetrahydropterin/6-carboxytetrahydropterin synthase
MFSISKEFNFSASHLLTGLPDDHQCARLHGHNYIVRLVLADSLLNEVGFVRDYGELKQFKTFVDDVLDHRHLNDVFDFNPTAENMARQLFLMFKPVYPQLACVQISETPKTWAEYANAE